MKKREIRYLIEQKRIHQVWVEFSKLHLALATQASFPDSSYYYKGKRNRRNWLYKELELCIPSDKLKIKCARLEVEFNRQYINYHEKVQVYDGQGNGYTAYDMDRMMAYS